MIALSTACRPATFAPGRRHITAAQPTDGELRAAGTVAARTLDPEAELDMRRLEAARGGSRDAFRQLMDRHAPGLYRLAMSLSSGRSDAEDLCQETFVAAFRGMRAFEGRSSVKTWLTRILIRRAAKLWRLNSRWRQSVSLDTAVPAMGHVVGKLEIASPGNACEQVDQRADILVAIRSLPARYREVVVLREIQGLSYQEIADALDVPRGTVESRLYRGRAALQEKLREYRNG